VTKLTKRNIFSEIVRRFSILVYRINGWTAIAENPPPRKCVIIAAPHTSNWDFIYYFGLTNKLKLDTHWVGKKSLFKWPFNGLMKGLGGFPVDRSQSQNLVQTLIDEFNQRDDFILTIPPEGTRGSVKQWRTGFYYVALGAGVPIICGLMDYARKTGGLGRAMMPTGDYEADMAKISDFYYSVTPKYPERAMKNLIDFADGQNGDSSAQAPGENQP